MRIIAVPLNEETRKIIWSNSRFSKEWENILKNPEYSHDPIEFYKEHGNNTRNLHVAIDGTPENIQEELLARLYGDGVTFESMSNSFPEDFIESRTSYEELMDYAYEMKRFIESLYDMIE